MGKRIVRIRSYRLLEQITRGKSVEEMQFGNTRGIESLCFRTDWNSGYDLCALFWRYALHATLLPEHRVGILYKLLQVRFRPRLGPRCGRFALGSVLKSQVQLNFSVFA